MPALRKGVIRCGATLDYAFDQWRAYLIQSGLGAAARRRGSRYDGRCCSGAMLLDTKLAPSWPLMRERFERPIKVEVPEFAFDTIVISRDAPAWLQKDRPPPIVVMTGSGANSRSGIFARFPHCVACGGQVHLVDHVVPVRACPARCLNRTNLQSLCLPCSNRITHPATGRTLAALDEQGPAYGSAPPLGARVALDRWSGRSGNRSTGPLGSARRAVAKIKTTHFLPANFTTR